MPQLGSIFEDHFSGLHFGLEESFVNSCEQCKAFVEGKKDGTIPSDIIRFYVIDEMNMKEHRT